jgi:hypothetical protein
MAASVKGKGKAAWSDNEEESEDKVKDLVSHCVGLRVYDPGSILSAWHPSSQGTCELHLSRDSSSPAYSS